MIIVKVLGGLGNQMFQYAYAKTLEIKGFEVKLDLSGFSRYKLHGGYQLNKYAINIENASTSAILLAKINRLKTVKEKSSASGGKAPAETGVGRAWARRRTQQTACAARGFAHPRPAWLA